MLWKNTPENNALQIAQPHYNKDYITQHKKHYLHTIARVHPTEHVLYKNTTENSALQIAQPHYNKDFILPNIQRTVSSPTPLQYRLYTTQHKTYHYHTLARVSRCADLAAYFTGSDVCERRWRPGTRDLHRTSDVCGPVLSPLHSDSDRKQLGADST